MARRKRPTYDPYMFPGLFDDPVDNDGLIDELPTSDVTPERRSKRSIQGGAASPKTAKEERAKALGPVTAPMPVKTLKYISFGSGSSGNCSYIGDERGGILIDAGVDPKYVFRELAHGGVDPSQVGGIILTHDHGDHVRYAYSIVRTYKHIRIYCTPRTLNGILRRHSISRRIKEYHQPIFKEIPFHIGNFEITPFEVFHDGADNVGFAIAGGGQCFVVATDMGQVSERADYYIRHANHLMMESNYDLSMLMNGSYPDYLKARILAKNGHMDNVATANYLSEIYTPSLQTVFLCHLSHDNNTPQTALDATVKVLEERGLSVGDCSGSIAAREAQIQVMALPRFESTGVITLRLK